MASELGLAEPVVPWHTSRVRVAALGSALATLAGALGKIALDVVLLAQTEVGELSEAGGEGRGGSSTLAHKRNPIGSILTLACARRAQAHASLLTGGIVQEHERAVGAWHAEWEGIAGVLAATGGAAANMSEVLGGLEVHPERMRLNLGASRGQIMSERLVFALAARIGHEEARRLVSEAAALAGERGTALRDELAADRRIPLTTAELDAAVRARDVRGRGRCAHRPRPGSVPPEALAQLGTTRRLTRRRAEAPAISLSPATRARTNITSVAPFWSGSFVVGMSVNVAVPSEPVLTSAGVDERPKGSPSTNTRALRTE